MEAICITIGTYVKINEIIDLIYTSKFVKSKKMHAVLCSKSCIVHICYINVIIYLTKKRNIYKKIKIYYLKELQNKCF